MALRSWLDYHKDPIAGLRPTRTRQRFLPQRRNIHGLYPTSYRPSEYYQAPVVSPEEIIDTIKERFSQQPLRRRGNILTRSMAKPEMPMEMAGLRKYGSYFQTPQQNIPAGGMGFGRTPSPARSDMLTTSYVMPKGAFSGPTGIQRNIPASDWQRQSAYNMGITGAGTRASYLNPATHWPESVFKTPTDVQGLPVFGSTIDLSAGKWYRPPSAWGRTKQYGRFGGKTVPTFGKTFRPSAGAINEARARLDWRKAKRKEAEKPRKLSRSERLIGGRLT